MRKAIDAALERGLVPDPGASPGRDLGPGYLITRSEGDWLFVPERMLASAADKRAVLEREFAAFNDRGES